MKHHLSVSEITRFGILQIFCVIVSNVPCLGVLGNLPSVGNLKQEIAAAVEVVFAEIRRNVWVGCLVCL